MDPRHVYFKWLLVNICSFSDHKLCSTPCTLSLFISLIFDSSDVKDRLFSTRFHPLEANGLVSAKIFCIRNTRYTFRAKEKRGKSRVRSFSLERGFFLGWKAKQWKRCCRQIWKRSTVPRSVRRSFSIRVVYNNFRVRGGRKKAVRYSTLVLLPTP